MLLPVPVGNSDYSRYDNPMYRIRDCGSGHSYLTEKKNNMEAVLIYLLIAISWIFIGWLFSNIKTDYEGYGCCIGLVGVCIFCPIGIPIWLLKYYLGYWGDTNDGKYYSWFNRGRGAEDRPKFLLTHIGEFIEKYVR